MNEYKKSLWMSNIIVLLFVLCATVIAKMTFNEHLRYQQQLTIENVENKLRNVYGEQALFDALIKTEQFKYVSLSKSGQGNALVYEDPFVNAVDHLIGEIAPAPIKGLSSKLTILVEAQNSSLVSLFKKILFVTYVLLILLALAVNLLYFRHLKRIEQNLIKEIANEIEQTESSFSGFSAQLNEQKRLHHQAIQNQEKQIFQLAQQVNMDNLTGLDNRHAFRKALTNILSDETNQQQAVLFIVRASELNSINTQRGYQYGDQYIVSISKLINKVTERHSNISVYRISGSDFGVIAGNMSINDAQNIANQLKVQFDQYQALNKLDSIAYNGISTLISGQLPEQVLARTDVALAKAQTLGINGWAFEESDCETSEYGQQEWSRVIDNILTKRSISLLHQPIQAIHRDMHGYQELFTRFMDDNNQMIPTDTVFAMALRVDLSVKLEQLIMETVINKCRNKTDDNTRWGVNVTSAAIQNSSFIIWLERLLMREANIAASLVFEMQEVVLDSNLVASKRIFDMLKRTGSRSAICNFGKGIGSFRLFKELKPDFVKVDASLIRNIERDSANQQFVRMIIDVAHRMDCRVIAEGIEHLDQKQILQNMYIDGVQGFLIARPTPV